MEIVKKAIATIAIMLMILTSSMTIAVTKQTGKVTTDTLRLRKEASLESTVLELIYKNEEVEILGEEGDWYKVKFKTYTGYVSKEYINKNEDVNTNTDTDENTNSNTNTNENNTNNNENQNENNSNNNQNTTGEENNTNNDNGNNSKNDIYANKKATLNSDLDVYILPLINSNIIGKLKQNTKVDIVSITGVWTYIKTEELAGWIRLDKISIVNEDSQSNNANTNNSTVNESTEGNTNNNQNQTNTNTNTETNTNTGTNTETALKPKTYYIKSSAVNVREKSTTSSSVVTTLSQNTQVKVVAEQSGWYKVEVNGKSGYILKSLLSEKKVEVTSRSSTQERDTNNATNEAKKTTNTSSTTKKEEEATSYNASKGEQVVAYAKKYLGCKYVYGGSGPNTFDCSGFTMYVYKKFGYSLPHSATSQSRLGKYVSKSNLQPGDLVIFNNRANTSIGHVGIYVGGGNFIHASSGGGKIMISSLSGSYYKTRYVTGRRLV